MHGMQQFNCLSKSRHSSQVQWVASVMISVEQGTPIQQQMDDSRMTFTRGNVERSQAFSVTLVNDESAFVGVKKLASGVVAPISVNNNKNLKTGNIIKIPVK